MSCIPTASVAKTLCLCLVFPPGTLRCRLTLDTRSRPDRWLPAASPSTAASSPSNFVTVQCATGPPCPRSAPPPSVTIGSESTHLRSRLPRPVPCRRLGAAAARGTGALRGCDVAWRSGVACRMAAEVRRSGSAEATRRAALRVFVFLCFCVSVLLCFCVFVFVCSCVCVFLGRAFRCHGRTPRPSVRQISEKLLRLSIGSDSRRREFCHITDTPSPSLSKRLLQREGGAAE